MNFTKYVSFLIVLLLANSAYGADCYYPGIRQHSNGAVTLFALVGDDFILCPDLRVPDPRIEQEARTKCGFNRDCVICVQDRFPAIGPTVTNVYPGSCGEPGRRPGARLTEVDAAGGIAP